MVETTKGGRIPTPDKPIKTAEGRFRFAVDLQPRHAEYIELMASALGESYGRALEKIVREHYAQNKPSQGDSLRAREFSERYPKGE